MQKLNLSMIQNRFLTFVKTSNYIRVNHNFLIFLPFLNHINSLFNFYFCQLAPNTSATNIKTTLEINRKTLKMREIGKK